MIRRFLVATILLITLAVGFAQTATVPTGFIEFIEQQWLLGKKKEVLQLAEVRLKENPDDLACLLITLDYATEFMELDRMKTIIPRIREVAATASSQNFDQQKSLLSGSLDVFEQLLPTITPEMAQAEAHKGFIKNKPLSSLVFIQALETDGLVAPVTPQERELVEGRLEASTPGIGGISQTSPNPSASPIQPSSTPAPPTATPAQQPQATTPAPLAAEAQASPGFPIVPVAIVGVVIVGIVLYLLRRKSP